jgi:hypothetical protein
MGMKVHLWWLILGAAACVALSAGCSSNGGGGKAGTGSDEAYVAGLCKAANKASDALDAASPSATPDDLGSALGAVFASLAPAMEQFAADFAKLNPPSDIADWHANTSKQLTAGAKALKDGNFDDPALDAITGNPTANMPAAARDRLKAIADASPDCKDLALFDASDNSLGSGHDGPPTPALQDAATGTWSGDFGTATFNSDGSASFKLSGCGETSSSLTPFGIDSDCGGQDYSGKLEVGHYEYTLRDSNGVGSVFAAYVDKSGKLHLGLGTVSEFGTDRKGTVSLFASGDMTVDGDMCSKESFSSSTPEAVTCHWTTVDGHDVLEYEGTFDTEHLVYLPDEGLVVSADVYVASLSKQ